MQYILNAVGFVAATLFLLWAIYVASKLITYGVLTAHKKFKAQSLSETESSQSKPNQR
jgi:hypothetical protein